MDSDDAAGCPDSDWTSSSYASDDEYDEQELLDSYRRLSTVDTTEYESEFEDEESDSSSASKDGNKR